MSTPGKNHTAPTLCVNWPRFGPYHLARLQATHKHAREQGAQLVALETARIDTTYEWDVIDEELTFKREVALGNQAYENTPPGTIHRSITIRLDAIQPDGVAISSYSTPDARACLSWCKNSISQSILISINLVGIIIYRTIIVISAQTMTVLIIILIILSSIVMCLDNPLLDPDSVYR